MSQVMTESFFDAHVRETSILLGSVLTMTDELTAWRMVTVTTFQNPL